MKQLHPDLADWMIWEGYGKVLARPFLSPACARIVDCRHDCGSAGGAAVLFARSRSFKRRRYRHNKSSLYLSKQNLSLQKMRIIVID